MKSEQARKPAPQDGVAAEAEIAAGSAILPRGLRRIPTSTSTKQSPGFRKNRKKLAASQVDALKKAISSRVLVVSGGPGVCKTTLVNSILLVLRSKKIRCLLCAPTGRAAKRLGETTGPEAKTIHRLLEFQQAGGFARGPQHPLDCDLLVADETSMIDVPL